MLKEQAYESYLWPVALYSYSVPHYPCQHANTNMGYKMKSPTLNISNPAKYESWCQMRLFRYE